jgi:two-component system invasion response regulator UvrY
MIRVVVVDDHIVVREGLKRIIGENPGMAVTGEAGDAFDALNVIRNAPCDVVLLDLSIPGKDGLDLLKQLHTEKPRLPVLILSSYPEDKYALRCLRSGAAGYLTKETALAEVVRAIRKVHRGGRYVSEATSDALVFSLTSDGRPQHETLSDREFQIVCMMAAGKTVSEIGIELALSVKTISTYRARVLEKLHLKSNADIIRYAIKQGLVY